jgi:hypothetical protein
MLAFSEPVGDDAEGVESAGVVGLSGEDGAAAVRSLRKASGGGKTGGFVQKGVEGWLR